MRFIVFGAGAVGGVLGGRLHEHGHDVVLIARGTHHRAIRDGGLRLECPTGVTTLEIPVAEAVSELTIDEDDIVLLTMKSQDTAPALHDLSAVAPTTLPVVSVQNGVENERVALRHFANVYGVCVMFPTTFLAPGVVQANSTPTEGILDVGRAPSGVDERAETLATAFAGAGFVSEPRPDIMRWKYAKLLLNLGNAIEAICGPDDRGAELYLLAKDEACRCLGAAGIEYASDEEDATRRAGLLRLAPVAGVRRGGGSTWQSLQRGTGTVEVDHLNGEIVLLGRLHGVPTPVNALLQELANRVARERRPPGSTSIDDVLALLDG